MAVFIVTNREVKGRRIKKNGKERAQPVFRVARFDERERHYELLPDAFRKETADDLRSKGARLGSACMFHDLHGAMLGEREERADVLFFIHGFNYKLDDSLEEIDRLLDVYVRPAGSTIKHLVYFSWPSVGRITAYRDDQEDAIATGLVLGRLFRTITDYLRHTIAGQTSQRCNHRIHLMCHSMGNQVLEHMVASLLQAPHPPSPIFSEIVLAHADIAWNALEPGKPLHELPAFGRRIHLYTHESDDALLISDWTKNGQKRLGRHGPKDLRNLPPRTVVVDTTDAPKGEDTSFREGAADHWGYKQRPAVYGDIRAVLRGDSSLRIPGRHLAGQNLFEIRPDEA